MLREQIKMLTGDVALNTSSLKRMLKEAARNPDDSALQVVSHDEISVEFLSFYIRNSFRENTLIMSINLTWALNKQEV